MRMRTLLHASSKPQLSLSLHRCQRSPSRFKQRLDGDASRPCLYTRRKTTISACATSNTRRSTCIALPSSMGPRRRPARVCSRTRPITTGLFVFRPPASCSSSRQPQRSSRSSSLSVSSPPSTIRVAHPFLASASTCSILRIPGIGALISRTPDRLALETPKRAD